MIIHYSLFFTRTGELISILAVYVDDILLTGNDLEEIQHIKGFHNTEFNIKNLRDIHNFLGMEILRETEGFIVNQRKFTLDMLQEFDVSHLKAVTSPLDPSYKLVSDDGRPLENPTVFRHLVEKLNYLTNARSDLSFVVLSLGQYMQRPCVSPFTTVLRVLKHLSADPGQGILLSTTPSFSLLALCDADWASHKESKRSISGYFITLGEAPISWKSKKQVSVSLPSTEAEYRSTRRVTAKLTWLVRLLEYLSAPLALPIPLHSDSKVAILIAHNPIFHERTKHVEIDCHFFRQ